MSLFIPYKLTFSKPRPRYTYSALCRFCVNVWTRRHETISENCLTLWRLNSQIKRRAWFPVTSASRTLFCWLLPTYLPWYCRKLLCVTYSVTLRYSTVLTVLTLQFSPVKVYFPAFEKVISKLCAFTYCMSSSLREKRVCTGKSLLRFRLNKLSQGSWNLEIY